MSLRTQIIADSSDVFMHTSEFAETITHTPATGSPAQVVAVVQRQPPTSDAMQDGLAQHWRARLYMASASLTNCTVDSSFTFDGVDWSCDAPPCDDGLGMTMVTVYRRLQVETSDESHRLPTG